MLPALIPFIGPVIDKLIGLIPNQAEREKARAAAEIELAKLDQKTLEMLLGADKAQADVNLEQVKSSDPFVSRARPAIMWICAFGLAWQTILAPCLGSALVFMKHAEMVVQLPQINGEVLMTMLGYMLGYGGMRSYEKMKGVASK